MIDSQIVELNKLRDQLNKDSCLPKEPFMKLGIGAAPSLNYNLPQSACFSTYGDIPIVLNANVFKPECLKIPPNNYFDIVSKADSISLQNQMNEAIQLQNSSNPLLANVGLLRNNLDMSKTNLSEIAIGRAAGNTGIGTDSIVIQNPNPIPILPTTDVVVAGLGTLANPTIINNPIGLPATPPLSSTTISNSQVIRPKIVEQTNAINEIQLSRLALQGIMPVLTEKLSGFGTKMVLLTAPAQTRAKIYIIEEYTTCSYLGDYGAGGTLQTVSLLPGEKTTITIKTYKESNITKTRSENLLDSMGQSSSDEMENLLEQENGKSSTNGLEVSANAKVETSASAKIAKLVKVSAKTSLEGSVKSTASRTANSRSLNRALNKHVAQSNSSRNLEVNTSSNENVKEGEENSIVRQIENINKSRVLNFVFRQLLQEYISITYLSNIRILYTNGYMETLRVVDLEDLNSLLEEIIVPAQIQNVTKQILKSYCNVMNYKDEMIQFIEEKTVNYGACLGINEQEKFWRKKAVEDIYSSGGLQIKIPGVILEVQKNILKTQSVVVDALLGQGEALDCFNTKAQDAIVVEQNLKNLELLQKLELINAITDPIQRTELYKKVFGTCCDVPQTQIIS